MAKLSTSQLVNATSVVATASYPFIADYFRPVSVQAVWTSSTSSMTITLQYSCDGTNYQDFTTGTSISNSSTNVIWDISTVKDALYWRVNLTRVSGTLTTLKVYLNQIERT
jgi:hypothetical protein